MKYQRAKAGFFRYADGKLLVVGGRIILALKDSDFFTDPIPPLSEVEAAYAAYQRTVIAASRGGRLHSTEKLLCKRRLADLLQQLAFYISAKSDGNLSRLYSSGFPVLAKKRKGTSPDTPEQPYLEDGRKSGEVAFGFKPVGRDMQYDYCFATEIGKQGNPIWGKEQTTTRSFRAYADGFVPGTKVYFRVRARNKHGSSDWTHPVSLLVR
ncbi:fibronectin type III domain-containing protein [Parapedobacter sp. 2B3]|uniref:fibronectin type III domain-containing protein n=1 Tax=Parapedobacter sp. 2B3 TaxID=3342381 RepID=UPI0035B69722